MNAIYWLIFKIGRIICFFKGHKRHRLPYDGRGYNYMCPRCLKFWVDDNTILKEFARKVIQTGCWGGMEMDGGDIQELAEGLGLLRTHTVTEQEASQYEDYDFEIGDIIYKYTDILKTESEVENDRE